MAVAKKTVVVKKPAPKKVETKKMEKAEMKKDMKNDTNMMAKMASKNKC